ncbi:MAG: twin-arginine translocase subunit TatB [Gammaproteobacteria bacterium]|nr:MAG: twin-arginine translocase subunit TatB [Gammaproteobacteria bacterium]
MFDIGFSELLLIGVVALIVVGPERLPGVIRTTLGCIRQLKAGLAHVKSEVEQELELDDIKQHLDETKADLSDAAGYDELNESLGDLRRESEKLRDIAADGFDYADQSLFVTDAEIEADMARLSEGPVLPAADSEADTGIEPDFADAVEHKRDTSPRQIKPKIKPKKPA